MKEGQTAGDMAQNCGKGAQGEGLKVTVDLHGSNFAKKIFFSHFEAQTLLYNLEKKINLKYLNVPEILRKKPFSRKVNEQLKVL